MARYKSTAAQRKQRAQQRARAAKAMRERTKKTGTKARLQRGTKPGTKTATTKSKRVASTVSKTRNARRGTGVKTRPVSGPPRGAQGPRQAPVQGPNRRVSGIIGSRQTTKSNRPPGGTPSPYNRRRTVRRGVGSYRGSRPAAGREAPSRAIRGGTRAAGVAARLARGGRAITPAGVAYETLRARPVADATMSGPGARAAAARQAKLESSVGKYNTRDKDGTIRSRLKVGPKKVGPKKVGTVAQAFDKAYAAAKKSGKKTFMFKGKKYTTK